MNKGRNLFLNVLCMCVLCVLPFGSYGQDMVTDSLVARGDSLRCVYDFDESIEVYNAALETESDTLKHNLINEKLTLAQNGKSLCSYVNKPTVVTKKMFSIEDFFLYYPLIDRSWRAVPNQLDPSAGPFSKAIYAPDKAKEIFFSALDDEGIRNIYRTEHQDTVWTFPSLLNEQMTSMSDEIYPMLSNDGKRLYFASKGLYGVGGYDIYVSEWNEEESDWTLPANMGFPYSSPANDFLFAESKDGKYSIFASDRDCPKDSVWVYVLEFDNMPVRNPVHNPEDLLRMSYMNPSSAMEILESKGDVKSEIPESQDTREYMVKMTEIRSLRDSIALCEDILANYREKYLVASNEDDRKRLEENILDEESRITDFQAQLDLSTSELQQIEMKFLFSGEVVDIARLMDEAEREVVAETADYTFSKGHMGEPLSLEIEPAEPETDYTFRVAEETQIFKTAEYGTGPSYQIHLITSGSNVPAQNFKGLTPVFEIISSSGRYIYRAGLFNAYNRAVSHLNTVKRLGFKNAYIVGYIDGKETNVNSVRALENNNKKNTKEYYRVNIFPAGGALDSASMAGIRQQSEGKDIARDDVGFFVGPFDNKSHATALIEFIEVMGYGEASLQKIE